MLRGLSTAALEHAQTRGTFSTALSGTGGQTLSDLSSEDEETIEEDEKMSCGMRFGLCIGYMIPSWGHLSLANVGRSWAAGAFALWHCFLFLNTAILIFINSCSTVLRCYIQWFSEMREGEDRSLLLNPFNGDGHFYIVLHFFGAFFRAYILISVTSDVIRFTYLLCVDAWRHDAFEAYRRLVVGDAWKELAVGQLYCQSWSVCLTKCQKAGDVIFQFLLHLSIDLIPLIFFIVEFATSFSGVATCGVCLAISSLHIFLFYSLWLSGEVYLKVSRLCAAWKAARSRTPLFMRQATSGIRNDTDTLWLSPNGTQFLNSEAEHRSLCVLCCTIFHWLEYLMPVGLALTTFSVGLAVGRGYLTEVGAVSGCLLLFVMLGTHDYLDSLAEDNQCTPRCIKRLFPRSDALQRWGERWARLGFNAQKRQRYPFAITLGFTALVFGGFRLMTLTYSCLGMMLYVCLRLLWMRVEGHAGWFWAFLEFIIETILLNILILMTTSTPLVDTALILLLSVMRQFGFQREINSGERVRLALQIILGAVQVLLLSLVCYALVSASDPTWSAFGPYMGSKKWYDIPREPADPELAATYPMCLIRFPHGEGGPKGLSLTDFGLMASLTYEPPSRTEAGCKHYFPEWHIEPKPEGLGSEDWVKFSMFTSNSNRTTVLAVRGTLSALDVLHDVTLWLVPAVLQLFNYIGPDVSDGSWGMAMSRLLQLFPLAPFGYKQTTYDSVLRALDIMKRHYPDRLYYLTGHSLGGGIAKLVELQLDAQVKPLTIAFAAPGVTHAARVLFPHKLTIHGGRQRISELATLTVQPENDVVSRIDIQIGNTMNSPCDGRALACHSIYRTLWGFFEMCGSMTDSNLTVPCGWSPDAPC